MVVLLSGNGTTVKSFARGTMLAYSAVSTPLPVTPTVTSETVGVSILNKNTATGSRPGYSLELSESLDSYTLTLVSGDIADQIGNLFQAKSGATGQVKVVIGNRKGASSLFSFPANSSGAAVTYDLDDYTEGTAAKLGFDVLVARLSAGGESNYYNGTSYAESVADGGISRNASCWGAGWDLSGVCVYYIYGNFNGGGCLVTNRHYLVSNHYEKQDKTGWQIKFVGSGGTVYTRTVVAQTLGSEQSGDFIVNPVYNIGDVCLLLLDSALPEDVAVYPIAGDWLVSSSLVDDNEDGTANYQVEWSYPVVTTNQYRHITFAVCGYYASSFSVTYPAPNVNIDGVMAQAKAVNVAYMHKGPRYLQHTDKQSAAIVGDSGSVWFFPMPDGSLAAFSLFTTNDSGPLLNPAILNAMIAEVDAAAGISTGLTVTVATSPI